MTTVGTGEWLGGCPSLSGVLALSGVRASLHGSQRPGSSALRFTWASRTPATFSRAHAHARKTDVPYPLGVRIVCGPVGSAALKVSFGARLRTNTGCRR